MSQNQAINFTAIFNNTIDLGKEVTPFAGLYFVGKLIMEALNNSGHDFAQLKHLKSVKSVHWQKIAWAFCVLILLSLKLLWHH